MRCCKSQRLSLLSSLPCQVIFGDQNPTMLSTEYYCDGTAKVDLQVCFQCQESRLPSLAANAACSDSLAAKSYANQHHFQAAKKNDFPMV